MIKNFRKEIKEAIRHRQETDFPSIFRVVPVVVIFTFLYCLMSVYVVPPGKPPDFNFQEEGAMTALSMLYLSMACSFAIGSNLIHIRAKGRHQWVWTILALGFAFLAFDELLQFHERFGRIVIDQIIPRMFFRNWNDAIVVIYGVIAVPVMLMLLPGLLRYRKVFELFVIAFIFYAIHTFIDSTQEPATLTSIIFEESAKLFSVAFLAMASFTGLLTNVWHFSEAEKTSVKSSTVEQTKPVSLEAGKVFQ